MVTTRRAAARARGEAEPRKRYAEEDDEVGVEFEEEEVEGEELMASEEGDEEEAIGVRKKTKGGRGASKRKRQEKSAPQKTEKDMQMRREEESQATEAAAAVNKPVEKPEVEKEKESKAAEEAPPVAKGQEAPEKEIEETPEMAEEEPEYKRTKLEQEAGRTEAREPHQAEVVEEEGPQAMEEITQEVEGKKGGVEGREEAHGGRIEGPVATAPKGEESKEEQEEAPPAEGGPTQIEERGIKTHEEEKASEPRTGVEPSVVGDGHEQIGGVETVEQGQISFYYRPKVGVEEAEAISDVQRFYMILTPVGGRPRLAVIGKKRLPAAGRHERFFGFIEAVADSVDALTSGLGPKSYETKTRGIRHVASARVVAEGSYAIVNRGGTGAGVGRTHLVFRLEVPSKPGEVQEDFGIPKEGSYAFSVKNPANEPPQGQAIGLEEKAEYPTEKKQEFGGYAWIGVTDPELLNYKRCEFLLVAATEDVGGELGASASQLVEGASEATHCAHPDEECFLNALKEEIQAEKRGIETQPMETGAWK